MSANRTRSTAQPRVDLETVRLTLAYMTDDMKTTPELGRVHAALMSALREIDAVEAGGAAAARQQAVPAKASNITHLPAFRFERWQPGN